MAFGLVSSITTSDYKSLNSRRKIFRQFPNGAAPLMGLLSLLPNGEDTDKPEFGWHEERFPTQRTSTVATGTAPFLQEDGSALTDLSVLTENVEYRVKVKDTTQFKATHVIEIRALTIDNTLTTTYDLTGIVTRVVSATVLQFRPTSTLGTTSHGIDNGTADNFDKNVIIKGTANRENARSGTGIITFPINPTNYTQIFRSAFAISRTALKGGLKYDSSGPYKTLAWTNGLRHLIEMEKAFLFGERQTVNVADPETGDLTPETKTGGIVWYLKQWEAAASLYRGPTSSAVTLNADDDKRIIELGGTLSRADLNKYLERAFVYTNDKAYEKLCLCGGRFLSVVNQLLERDALRQTAMNEKGRDWQFIVHSLQTLRGTIHFKVHPLFDNDPDLRYNGLILDIGNMKFRPLSDSDTKFLKGRQETDRDGRKDEWITEAGLEMHFPESCMYIKNAQSAA